MKSLNKIILAIYAVLCSSLSIHAQISWDSLSPQILNGLDGGVHMPSITATAFINGTDIYYVSDQEGVQEGDVSLYGDGLPQGWNNITGAARWNDNTIMLFNGSEYALFNLDEVSITYRGPFPNVPSAIDAVSNWGDTQILFL